MGLSDVLAVTMFAFVVCSVLSNCVGLVTFFVSASVDVKDAITSVVVFSEVFGFSVVVVSGKIFILAVALSEEFNISVVASGNAFISVVVFSDVFGVSVVVDCDMISNSVVSFSEVFGVSVVVTFGKTSISVVVFSEVFGVSVVVTFGKTSISVVVFSEIFGVSVVVAFDRITISVVAFSEDFDVPVVASGSTLLSDVVCSEVSEDSVIVSPSSTLNPSVLFSISGVVVCDLSVSPVVDSIAGVVDCVGVSAFPVTSSGNCLLSVVVNSVISGFFVVSPVGLTVVVSVSVSVTLNNVSSAVLWDLSVSVVVLPICGVVAFCDISVSLVVLFVIGSAFDEVFSAAVVSVAVVSILVSMSAAFPSFVVTPVVDITDVVVWTATYCVVAVTGLDVDTTSVALVSFSSAIFIESLSEPLFGLLRNRFALKTYVSVSVKFVKVFSVFASFFAETSFSDFIDTAGY